MNLKLTTFANYSGNSKLAEASKTLKYGDLEIRLINDEYYFVHDNGATIDNISLIKMIGSNFKGLISTFPQSITSDLINYAPSMTLFINSLTDFVKKTELQDGTFDLIVSSVTADGFISCISLSTTTSASIGSTLSCNSLTVSSNANIYGLLNGCNIATTSLSSLGTLPIIPVIKSDSIMEVGRYLDFHYNNSDDYNARIECESDGAIKIINNNNSNHPLRVLSQNSSSVQIQVGKRTGYTNDCAIIQYNLSGPTLGFGFWNGNNKMTLDPNGNLSTTGTITSPTITSINDAIDGKAPLEHTHSYNDLTDKLDLGNYSAQIPKIEGKEGWNRYFKVGQGDNFITCSISSTDAFAVDRSGNVSCTGTITANNVNINTELNNKAPLSHNHSISDISNLQTTLDSKASTTHTHTSSNIIDIQTYVDNRISSKFNQLFDLLHPIGSVMILQNALSVLGATPTFEDNHLYYSWNETTWEYLPDAVFIRNGGIDSITHEETGATNTPSGSNTHNHTTADHTLTKNEMPSHNHSIFCSETNQKQGNNQKLLSSDTYGQYGNWLNQTNYWIGEEKPQPFINHEGGGQPHNHGNTSTESNVPVHIVAYFYVRIA